MQPTFYTILASRGPNGLIKDGGMIPYYMHKLGYYESYIVSYIPNDSAINPYLEYIKGVNLVYIPHHFSQKELSEWPRPVLRTHIDLLWYIWKNASKIDVLNLYFIKSSIPYAIIYRLKNRKGKCYVKADIDITSLPSPNSITGKIKCYLQELYIKTIPTLVSVETQNAYSKCHSLFHLGKSQKIQLIPNGIDDIWLKQFKKHPVPYEKKENIILTVARFGTKQKNTEFLLDVCKMIKWSQDWRFIAIGSIETSFQSKLDKFFIERPDLQSRVIFKGSITDRFELFQWYGKSKIFCMTSKYESFGIVYAEALSMGNYIISTPVIPLSDFIDDGCGTSCDTREKMAETLEHLMTNNSILYEAYPKVFQKSKNFYWSSICGKIYSVLNSIH